VIGHPIGHTLSPFIHTRLMQLSGIDGDYGVFDVAPQELDDRFKDTLSKLDGFNATIPHKQALIHLLDEKDVTADLYGSVNTVAFTHNTDGTLTSKGYTTDGIGFETALKNGGIPFGKNVTIIGCGGVGRVFANVCVAQGCNLSILECDAALASAREFAKQLNARCGEEIAAVYSTAEFDGESDLLVNATPLGMYPKTEGCAADDKLISKASAVFDAVYNPCDTVLVKKARANGAKAMSGMTMLVYQAAASQTIWNGSQFNPEDIDVLSNDCIKELLNR
ncbi:MAG: shikimate dehydrogenase, partial [Lachnospiraceae bacterium]|nr:shikimate dehydrogenase [Lachnospiraceae bacterium]